jgi:hypothetical protein
MHFDLWVREIENCQWVERLYSRVVFPPGTKAWRQLFVVRSPLLVSVDITNRD